ncbi:Uncharacterized protein HZ326_3166 [Fusarium oxysporum f. sp. albedinis]|nr:Uncharacterized protein HZ326_3166 [Fusarium oxysporum f. sp. albedinis]
MGVHPDRYSLLLQPPLSKTEGSHSHLPSGYPRNQVQTESSAVGVASHSPNASRGIGNAHSRLSEKRHSQPPRA